MNFSLSPLNTKILTSFQTHRHLWLLMGIIAIGTILRLYRLGDLGITENEDYVANAVKSVLETWLPTYPSGVIYPRALPLTYLTAMSVHIFGFEDFVLRIPSTIFSVLSIIVGYLLAARLFGIRVALIAALLIAFSDWEILLGRTARMYGMLSFFLLLSTWLLDKAIMEGGRILKSLTLASLIITCFIHKLAIMLLPFFLFYFLFRQPRGRALKYLIVCGLVTIFSYTLNNLIERHYYSQAFTVEASLIAEQKAKSTTKAPEIEPEKRPTNILNKILESTPAKLLSEKHLHIFIDAQKQHPTMALTLIIGLTASLIIYGFKNFRNKNSRIYTGAIALILLPLCFQQIMLALLIVLAYVILARALEPHEYRKRTRTLLTFCVITSISWMLLGTISLEGSLPENLYTTTMMLFSFPMSFFALYYTPYPFLSACAFASAAIALNRYLANGKIDEIGYIALLFTGTMLLMGFHPLALSNPYPRYVAFLNPYFLIMAAFTIDLSTRKLSQIKNQSAAKTTMIGLAAFLGAALIARETVYSTWYMINTNYGENKLPPTTAGYIRSFYPDQRTPALFVKDNASPEDIIIAMDSLAFYAYFSRINFQIRATGGTDAERWLGQRTLFSEKELRDILKEYRDHNIWITLEGKMLKQYKNNQQWADILNLITSQGGQPRYVGLDKLSSVYLIPSQTK